MIGDAGTKITPLEGTGAGEMEPGLYCALAKFGQAPCVVLGNDRQAEELGPMGPAGLREARRGFALAKELGLPVVTVIDTAGLALSKEAEEGGLAGEIGVYQLKCETAWVMGMPFCGEFADGFCRAKALAT